MDAPFSGTQKQEYSGPLRAPRVFSPDEFEEPQGVHPPLPQTSMSFAIVRPDLPAQTKVRFAVPNTSVASPSSAAKRAPTGAEFRNYSAVAHDGPALVDLVTDP